MKTSFLILIVAMLNICCGMSQGIRVAPDKFLVTGQLLNVPDSVKISLSQEAGQLIQPIAWDTVIGGTFTFSDTVSCTKKLLLISVDKGFPNNWLEVWVAPGKHIEIAGQDKMICVWQVKSDIPEQVETNNFQTCAWDLLKELTKHSAAEADYLKEMSSEEHRGDADFTKQMWAKIDSIRKISFPLQKQVFKKELDYMATAPVGKVWMEKLEFYAQMSMMAKTFMPYAEELKALYAGLPEAMKHTAGARLAYQYLYPPTTVDVGDEMADGDLYDSQGNVHRLSEFKGRYILLDFWSRGCGPCIQSIPEMEEIAEKYKDKLAVVSISIDPEKAWKEFIATKNMKGNQWNELRKGMTGLAASYQVKGYPHYVLIAPDGKIQTVWGGYGKGSLWNKIKENVK